MSLDKRIITHKWGNNPTHDEFTSSNGLIIPNHYNRSLATYQELATIAKEDFPHLKDSDIECCYVLKSSYNQGFPLVMFPLPENTTKEGYRVSERVDFSY